MLGELKIEEIDELLKSQVIGRLGCQEGKKIYIIPIGFCFDGEHILGHTSDGLKMQMMRSNPNVCFQIDHIENMQNWQSVILWGTYEELEGYDAKSAMEKFTARLQQSVTNDKSQMMYGIEAHQFDSGGNKKVVFRIKISEKTGRYEKR